MAFVPSHRTVQPARLAASIGPGGEQKVFWGCQRSQGTAHRKARRALILMGDWCAAAQPLFENQVRAEHTGWEYRLGRENAGTVAEIRSSLLTETANGRPVKRLVLVLRMNHPWGIALRPFGRRADAPATNGHTHEQGHSQTQIPGRAVA